MLKRLLDRLRPGSPPRDSLYEAIVAAARQPRLYADWGVPDTPAGRIEMVAVHTAIVTHALMALGPDGEERARGVCERYVTDMDDNMREIGVGDLTVPRKVKKAAAAVYDRVAAVSRVAQAATEAEQVREAGDLVTLEEGAERLDRDGLGRYFSRLVKTIAGSDSAHLLAPAAAIPLLAREI